MKLFVGMETSGQMRRRLQAMGHHVISCDTLASEDGAEISYTSALRGHSGHLRGDVFDILTTLREMGWRPERGILHPTCTLHTVSAAWAFNEPDFVRYPGVGYHQKVKPETLVGQARRDARDLAEADLERIRLLPFFKVVENPRGTIPTRTKFGPAADVLQPYEFGDDASKGTCVWAFDENGEPAPFKLDRDPAKRVPGRIVEWPRGSGKMVERWSNQTDSNQNNLTPGDDRWKDRSRTYPGIADAVTGKLLAVLP